MLRGKHLGGAESSGASMEEALNIAQKASETAHLNQLKIWWDSLNYYVQAHGEFGRELSVFGNRSMISFTTDLARATWFASNSPTGKVISTLVLKSLLIPQTLPGSTESEFLVLHMLGLR